MKTRITLRSTAAGWLGACAALLLTAALPAQVVATMALGAPSGPNPNFATASAMAKVGIALPSAPHLLPLWNFAGAGFDRIAGQNGGALETGLALWVSPALRPAQSHAPLLILEAGLGRRWGTGLHGYTAVGVGAGWSLGDWVPYIEFRRRASFYAGRPTFHQILIGFHFILFG